MIGALFPKKKRTESDTKPAATRAPEPIAVRHQKPPRFNGGTPEKARDYLGGHDGERIGFRKPIED